MSSGISVICDPEIEDLDGYYQELGEFYEQLSLILKSEGCNILPYLFCPESDLSEDEINSGEHTAEEQEIVSIISTDDFHDADEVYEEITTALDVVRSLEDEVPTARRAGLISDLENLTEELEIPVEEKAKVQLLRG